MTRAVIQSVCNGVDSLSAAARVAAAIAALALILCTLFEVVMRYFFASPTIWSYDIAYMLNGSVFLLAAAGALQSGKHVQIDFLSTRFPDSVQRVIEAVFFLGPCSIALGLMTQAAFSRTIRAFQTGETEAVSPWAPLMWPFYTALSIGLALLLLQVVAQGLRALFGLPFKTGDQTQ